MADRVESLLLLPNGYQVAAMMVGAGRETARDLHSELHAAGRQTILLGVLRSDDTYTGAPAEDLHVEASDRLLLYGSTRDLEAILRARPRAGSSSQ